MFPPPRFTGVAAPIEVPGDIALTWAAYAMKVPAGDWTVNIRAVREKGPVDPKAREAPREQYIPAKYNGDSKVVVTLPSEKKEFNYDLEP